MWMKLGMFDWCINNLFTNFNVKYVMKYSMKFNSFNQGLKNFRKKRMFGWYKNIFMNKDKHSNDQFVTQNSELQFLLRNFQFFSIISKFKYLKKFF